MCIVVLIEKRLSLLLILFYYYIIIIPFPKLRSYVTGVAFTEGVKHALSHNLCIILYECVNRTLHFLTAVCANNTNKLLELNFANVSQ